MAGGGYTKLTRGQLLSKNDTMIKPNGAGEITGPILNEVLADLAQSLPNILDDAVGLKDYDTEKFYKAGDTCLVEGVVKKCSIDTSGTYNPEAWDNAAPLARTITLSAFITAKNAGTLKVGYYLITNAAGFDLGVVVAAVSNHSIAPKAWGLYLEPDYNGQVLGASFKGVWAESLLTFAYDNLTGVFELNEKVDNNTSGGYGTVVSDIAGVLILKNLSVANLNWNNNDAIEGRSSGATADINGAVTKKFPVSVNDKCAWNGLMYKNITGINSQDDPETDTTNWELLTKSQENGYVVDVCDVDYNPHTDSYSLRADRRGNIVKYKEGYLFQFGSDNVTHNDFSRANVNCINNRGSIHNNICNQDCDITISQLNEGGINDNIFIGRNQYDLYVKSGKYLDKNVFLITDQQGYEHDGETMKNQVLQGALLYVTPTTGETIQIDFGIRRVFIKPAGTIAALTVELPDSNFAEGKEIDIISTQQITALTITSVKTVIGGLTSLGVGSAANVPSMKLTYIKAIDSWVRS